MPFFLVLPMKRLRKDTPFLDQVSLAFKHAPPQANAVRPCSKPPVTGSLIEHLGEYESIRWY